MSTTLKNWQVTLNNYQGSPKRFNRYLRVMRNCNAIEIEQKLKFMVSPYCEALRKLVKSAIANASSNKDVDLKKLVITHATVGRGRFLKRITFRGRGRVGRITKFSSNVVIALSSKEGING